MRFVQRRSPPADLAAPSSEMAAALGGTDRATLADVWPPVRFGFGSTPRAPSAVSVASTVDEIS